ncbi:ATP-binding protein [Amaricoccus macauensis]|uniref:ATP-binding protein n=1 Tax=Amaricoccus macauensis TaxID=57001 RepID=UPI003C797BAF
MLERNTFGRLALVAISISLMLAVSRELAFGHGVLIGVAPASGVALCAVLLMRGAAVPAIILGYALGDILGGLSLGATMTNTALHGLAAYGGANVMRKAARRRRPGTKTGEWQVFVCGAWFFALLVAAGSVAAQAIGLIATDFHSLPLAGFVFLSELLGVLTVSAVLLNYREFPKVRDNLRPTLGISVLGIALLCALEFLLHLPPTTISPSHLAILLSIPLALWIAMLPRSLDGAAVTFLVMHAALFLLVAHSEPVVGSDFIVTILFLNVLTMACQFVHSVNLDRLAALVENKAHKSELEKRVEERTARLLAMTEHAVAADEAKSKFIATISHELRTPLNGVIGMASVVLASNRLDPETRQNVNMIHGSGLHLLSIINRILDFSRLGEGIPKDADTIFDIEDLMTEVVNEARFAPEAAGLDIRGNVEPGVERRRLGYRQGVRQVLTNLVGNAIKFTDEGTVKVRISEIERNLIRVEVCDTGPGIPANMTHKIFRPFEQGGSAVTRRYGGTGLGLAICKEIVSRMKGRIGVESEPGAGSRFWFEVPLSSVPQGDGSAKDVADELQNSI